MPIRAIVFDLGDTLIEQSIDSEKPLDQMSLRLLAGVQPALEQLRSKYTLGILTNTVQSDAPSVRRALEPLGISRLIDAVVTSVDVGARKPDARCFAAILTSLRVEPTDAVMIGNDPAQDIAGARSAGMLTGYYSPEGHRNGIPADFTFRSFRELPQAIETIAVDAAGTIRKILAAALEAEAMHKWLDAAECFMEVAHRYKAHRLFDEAADYFMRAAVAGERAEPWRGLGFAWVRCATALESRPTGPVSDLYDPVEASSHYFPTLDFEAWQRFSLDEKIGRAYRNAAYHLEKAGANQSAYVQYEKSGDAFRRASALEEASRSYFHCVRSFIDRNGEVDSALLEKLDNTNEELIRKDRNKYLKRSQIYYRGLAGRLQSRGNHPDANALFAREAEFARRLALEKKHYGQWLVYSLWKYSCGYGNSFGLWCAWAVMLFLVMFPMLYLTDGALKWADPTSLPTFLDYLFFSVATVTSSADPSFVPLWVGKLIALIETGAGLVMLGALASLLAKKIVR